MAIYPTPAPGHWPHDIRKIKFVPCRKCGQKSILSTLCVHCMLNKIMRDKLPTDDLIWCEVD